jgi:hypothetical protein
LKADGWHNLSEKDLLLIIDGQKDQNFDNLKTFKESYHCLPTFFVEILINIDVICKRNNELQYKMKCSETVEDLKCNIENDYIAK